MNNKKRPFLVTVAILSIVTVFVWIIFSSIRAFQKPSPINVPPEILEPVSPTLDVETLQTLDSKFYFSEFDSVTTNLFLPEQIDIEEEEEVTTPTEEEEEEGESSTSTEEDTDLENATESGNL